METNRFIFQESDFDDPNFNSGAFVARYRRVAPLDSLKEQLRAYCASLKLQLYDVINKDYANFIKISTKVSSIPVYCSNLSNISVLFSLTELILESKSFANQSSPCA